MELEPFHLEPLTVLLRLDLGAFVLPHDHGRWGARNLAHDVGVVAFIELLRARSFLEGDLLCGQSRR